MALATRIASSSYVLIAPVTRNRKDNTVWKLALPILENHESRSVEAGTENSNDATDRAQRLDTLAKEIAGKKQRLAALEETVD